MPVRVYSDDEQRALNESSVAANKTKLGTTLAVMQEAINSGGGGGDVSDASNTGPMSAARVFRDKVGTILNFRRIAGGVGATVTEHADYIEIAAAGGSAYPENVTIHSGAGVLDLDASHQGIVIITGTGSVRLPASAVAGTTYKISAAAGLATIDTNGSPIFGYGTGVIKAGRVPMILKRITSPAVGWTVENKNTVPVWDAAAAYGIGDLVEAAGIRYESRIDDNINNDPATSRAQWRVFGQPDSAFVTGDIDYGDLDFESVSPPTGGSGSYRIYAFGRVRFLEIQLSFPSGSTSTTAVNITAAKASEIRDALFNAFGMTTEEDVFGTGHVVNFVGLGFAKLLSKAIYSPTNLEYIRAEFEAFSNILQLRMVFTLFEA